MLFKYEAWVLELETIEGIIVYSPKLDFKRNDLILIDGETANKANPRFKTYLMYEFEVYKVIWKSCEPGTIPPYPVGELQLLCVNERGKE